MCFRRHLGLAVGVVGNYLSLLFSFSSLRAEKKKKKKKKKEKRRRRRRRRRRRIIIIIIIIMNLNVWGDTKFIVAKASRLCLHVLMITAGWNQGRSLRSEVMGRGQSAAEECRLTSIFGRKFECLKAGFHGLCV